MQAPRCLYPVGLSGVPLGVMEDRGHQLLSPPNALWVLSRLVSLYCFGVCLCCTCYNLLPLYSVPLCELFRFIDCPILSLFLLSFLKRFESGL